MSFDGDHSRSKRVLFALHRDLLVLISFSSLCITGCGVSGGSGQSSSAPSSVVNAISTYAGVGTSGSSGDGLQAANAQLAQPLGLAIDISGNLFIADSMNNRIRKVDTAGIMSTVVGNGAPGFSGDGGPALSAKLSFPTSLAVDSSGILYINDYGNNRIRKVSTAGIITTAAGNGSGLVASGDGGLAVSASLLGPNGIAVDSANNLLIADTGRNTIRKVNSTGYISSIAGSGTSGFSGDGGPATIAQLNQPYGVFVDAVGNIYVADKGNSRVRKINTSGYIYTIAGTSTGTYTGDGGPAVSAGLVSPRAIYTDSKSNVFITDYDGMRIRKITDAGVISTYAGTGSSTYQGSTNLPVGDGGPAASAVLTNPYGIVIDSGGRIYVADSFNNRIRRIAP